MNFGVAPSRATSERPGQGLSTLFRPADPGDSGLEAGEPWRLEDLGMVMMGETGADSLDLDQLWSIMDADLFMYDTNQPDQ